MSPTELQIMAAVQALQVTRVQDPGGKGRSQSLGRGNGL